MDILKRISINAFHTCVIAMLIYGDENMRTFSLCVAALITVVAWLGVFTMKPDTAKAIHATLPRRVFSIAVNIAYVYALIVSGSPIWAAFFMLGFAAIRLQAAKTVADQEKADATP